MSQGNHPDHPPVDGGYTGKAVPLMRVGLHHWEKVQAGVYKRNDNLKVSFGVHDGLRGVWVKYQGHDCFIPQMILGEQFRDFGYSMVSPPKP